MKRAALAGIATLALCASAAAAPQPGAYQENDGKGFWNIAPPGANGLANGQQLIAFLTAGQRPANNTDQLGMYGDLVYAAPGLSEADLPKYFKDASFGVKQGLAQRTYSPRDDVTIVRDEFGVPRIYGNDRNAVEFGAGYATAEDRLFFIDVLRHLGRAQLAAFAGGAPGNRAFDREQWSLAPYTEDDLRKQVDNLDDLYGDEGRQMQEGITHYTAGVNAYISEARLNPNKMPGEYPAVNRPQGPADWQEHDVVAIAALVGGIFGKGGGGEVRNAQIYQAAIERFGRRRGIRVYRELRSAEDPEAPTTTRKRFRYLPRPKRLARGSLAMPDAGSIKPEPVSNATDQAGQRAIRLFPKTSSNALLVSARESRSGHPLAVFGPQTGYFAPQILMEQEFHAPNMDARGASFPGTNLVVQLGRGRDYAWSATSANQDLIDTYALELCDDTHYRWNGDCREFERLVRENSWTPSAADQTAAGSETLTALRTPLGIVSHRGTIGGKPVVFTKLRSTYFHEVDSAIGFIQLNDPTQVKSAADAQRAFAKIGYTFNWFYADDRQISFFNSGNNPVRPRGIDNDFPTWGKPQFLWKGMNTDNNTAQYTPFEQHPQEIDKSYFANWNNKQAPGFRAADDKWGFQSLYRSRRLEDRIRAGIRGRKKMTLTGLIDAMEDGGTVDQRGAYVLPWALRVIGTPKDPKLAEAVAKLREWAKTGAHRRDRDRSGTYDHADAVQIMDAWWPVWMEHQFKPAWGDAMYPLVKSALGDVDNHPNNHGQHLGSAFQEGFYGYAQKDLRNALGGKTRRRIKGRYSRIYCGGTNARNGTRARCRASLLNSLGEALKPTREELYGDDETCKGAERGDMDLQMCFDAVRHRPLGGITQPLIHWIDRPTFQQAVEIQGRAPR